jgi:hypothetical protein
MFTTSSSRRKRRTTAWSRLAAAALGTLALVGCSRSEREIYLTYFNGEYGLSVRRPAGWHTDQAEQDGVWYRYFLAPPEAPGGRAPVSVTLLAGTTPASLDDYAQSYLAGHTVASTRPEERQGVKGRSWTFASADGATRYRLLLLAREGRVAGLYAQGDAGAMERLAPALDEMWASFTIERPDLYPRTEWKAFHAALGLPPSWREVRRFSGGTTLLAQYQSPPLALDKGRQTVHASLTVTFEPVPDDGGLQVYYDSTRRKLGDNFAVTSHSAFKGGYVDVMRTETPVTVSFVKRFYFADGKRGCSLSFEAREDVFPRASRWADYIASTLRFGSATSGSAGPADGE